MALTKISTGGVKDDAASQAKIADEAVDEARLQISNAGTNGQFLQKQSGDTGGLTWATVNSTPEGDVIKSTGIDVNTKVLRTDGDGTCSWATVPDDPNKADKIGAEFTDAGVGLKGSNQLKFYDPADSSNYVQVKAPSLTANTTYSLPTADGSDGDTLKTNGSGVLSWATAASGGLSEVDAWTLTGNWPFVHSGGSWTNARLGNHANDSYTGTLERKSENNMPLGTGMTNTNGLFTFPSAGTWRIDCMLHLERYQTDNMNGLRVGLCGDVDGNSRQLTTTEQDINSYITHTTINLSGVMKFTNTGTTDFYVKLNGSGNVYIKALSSTQNLIFTKLA